tara:strand:+ start:708 stop:836 length:129 start_codon:yes stop_codon:yes gene_type:complete
MNVNIYHSGEDGLVFDMKEGDESRLIDVQDMGEPSMASPVLS